MSISYNFTWSDNTNPSKIAIPTLLANGINSTSTSLILNGNGSMSWGYTVQQNLLHLMENFASRTSMGPGGIGQSPPTIGQLWYNIDSAMLNLWSHPIVLSGSFITGHQYTINSTGNGTTNFMTIGAADNNFGSTFTYNGNSQVGTGSAKDLGISAWSGVVTTDSLSFQLTGQSTYIEQTIQTYGDSHYASSITGAITAATTLISAQSGQEFTVTNTTGNFYSVSLPATGTWRFKFVGGTSNPNVMSLSTVNAGNFISGQVYTISVIGTTDFIACGATSNTIGLSFTAINKGAGTGTATIPNGLFTTGSSTLSVYLITGTTLYLPDGTTIAAGTIPSSIIDLAKLGDAFEIWSDGSKIYLSRCEGNSLVKTATYANHAVPLSQVLELDNAVLATVNASILGAYTPISFAQTDLISAATTLSPLQNGLEFAVIATSSFDITLPTTTGVEFRYKFFGGTANPAFIVNLIWTGATNCILPDGTIVTSSIPINLATYGNSIEVWSSSAPGTIGGYAIYVSKIGGQAICKSAIANNEAVTLGQFNSTASTTSVSTAVGTVSTVTVAAAVAAVSHTKTFNPQTGTTYQFVLTDGSQTGLNPFVTFANASPVSVTLPPNSTVAFPVGAQIDCLQDGAGKVTIVAGAGVTINSLAGNKSIAGQYGEVTLIQESINNWYLTGILIA